MELFISVFSIFIFLGKFSDIASKKTKNVETILHLKTKRFLSFLQVNVNYDLYLNRIHS